MIHALMHFAGLTDASGPWYLFWSGIFGDITIFGGAFVLARRHNCHVKGCPSLFTSSDPAVHAPACRRHHSHGHLHGKEVNK